MQVDPDDMPELGAQDTRATGDATRGNRDDVLDEPLRKRNRKMLGDLCRDNPERAPALVENALNLHHESKLEIHVLREQNAKLTSEINALRGVPADRADIFLAQGFAHCFPHECIIQDTRAIQRKKRMADTDDDTAVTSGTEEDNSEVEKQYQCIRNNKIKIELTLKKKTPKGSEPVAAVGIERSGLDFHFEIGRTDGVAFCNEENIEWKCGLKTDVVGFLGPTLSWTFGGLPLSSKLQNSSLFVEVTCTTVGFEHIKWTSPHFMCKARRDQARLRTGQHELETGI